MSALSIMDFLATVLQVLNNFEEVVKCLTYTMNCPGAIGNPFIHLRLGQSQYEVGNLERAADELTRAFAIEGEQLFEEDNPKYFEFLKTKIDTIPPKKKKWWKF